MKLQIPHYLPVNEWLLPYRGSNIASKSPLHLYSDLKFSDFFLCLVDRTC